MSSVIGQIAHCEDCTWSNEDYTEARRKAYAHHKTTGHGIWGETTTAFSYPTTTPTNKEKG
jgi:hypothetical protein